MLDLKNLKKTFNAKTVNEKIALDGLTLRCFDRQRMLLVDAKEKLTFDSNATLGTLSSLYSIVFE